MYLLKFWGVLYFAVAKGDVLNLLKGMATHSEVKNKLKKLNKHKKNLINHCFKFASLLEETEGIHKYYMNG